jgi:hypothetical protein
VKAYTVDSDTYLQENFPTHHATHASAENTATALELLETLGVVSIGVCASRARSTCSRTSVSDTSTLSPPVQPVSQITFNQRYQDKGRYTYFATVPEPEPLVAVEPVEVVVVVPVPVPVPVADNFELTKAIACEPYSAP